MTLEHILRALLTESSAVAKDCVRALKAGAVAPTFPPLGRMTAGEARVQYKHRLTTLVAAGIRSREVDACVARLATLAPDEEVTLAAFSGASDLYTVFFDSRNSVVGCFWVGKAEKPTD